jgi:hypothetical protein
VSIDQPLAEVPEEVARVALAGWVGESGDVWDTAPALVLGTIGDDLYLVEIDESNRERVLVELIDRHAVGDPSLRIELAFFGAAGGFFASSLDFLDAWPKSSADVPADVFVDDRHRAAFTKAGDDIVVSVRHALRPSDAPPKRRFRFHPSKYEEAMRDLARESRRLRDDLIAVAQQRAPHKVGSLQEALKPGIRQPVLGNFRGNF